MARVPVPQIGISRGTNVKSPIYVNPIVGMGSFVGQGIKEKRGGEIIAIDEGGMIESLKLIMITRMRM